jgi:hypothetical protein
MGADSTIAVTPGAGATLRLYAPTAGGSVQYVTQLDASATGAGPSSWTLATTAATSVIAADITRTTILMVNWGSARVCMNFSATAPTTALADWFLDPGDRYTVPDSLAKLAVSFIAQAVGGSLSYTLGTIA